MDINPGFNNYMDRYFHYLGMWNSPSVCGLKTVNRQDGKTVAIVTEIYRQNPGTSVTEWCAPLATLIMHDLKCTPENFIFLEHTPDFGSKLAFYEETFDLVTFDRDGEGLINPVWTRLSRDKVDEMLKI